MVMPSSSWREAHRQHIGLGQFRHENCQVTLGQRNRCSPGGGDTRNVRLFAPLVKYFLSGIDALALACTDSRVQVYDLLQVLKT